MFTRILVPTDLSTGSDAALAYGKALAERFGASLHLLHVMEDPVTMCAFGGEAFVAAPPTLRDSRFADAEMRLSCRLPAGSRGRLRATTTVVVGTIAHAIVDHASEHGVDLIVMGTHGRTGLGHLLMGSIAEYVVRTATCPVLTIREGGVTREHAIARFEYAAVAAA